MKTCQLRNFILNRLESARPYFVLFGGVVSDTHLCLKTESLLARLNAEELALLDCIFKNLFAMLTSLVEVIIVVVQGLQLFFQLDQLFTLGCSVFDEGPQALVGASQTAVLGDGKGETLWTRCLNSFLNKFGWLGR